MAFLAFGYKQIFVISFNENGELIKELLLFLYNRTALLFSVENGHNSRGIISS